MALPKETHGIGTLGFGPASTANRFTATQVRNTVVRLASTKRPATPITNLRVTPIGFGNIVDFTRSDGDAYTLYWSTTGPTWTSSNPIPLGTQSRYSHSVGKDGVKVWYWIVANRTNGIDSKPVGPKVGTTLLSNAAVTVPSPPPPDYPVTVDVSTGRIHGLEE